MSSPPNLSTSPTFTSSMNLPSKKRPLAPISGSSASTSKRRKPSHPVSTNTGFSHPLRQTSFPPDEANRMLKRSSSVESSVAGSAITGRSGKRGKRAKDTQTIGGGSAKNGIARCASKENLSLVDGKSGTGAVGEEEDDDDDENDAGTTMMFDGGGQADEDQEKQKLAILVDSFNEDQSDRYDLFRRVKLQPSALKKIANQTLSQSIPPLVVTTIGGLSKVFIGEIVERAREVQAQWLAAATPDGVFKEEMRGPLLPDHLREAVRRYRKDGEGGGAGFRGLSLGALEGSFAGGRGGRLFK
ncbi:hypothetical protein FGG08_000605 [Glutinoglossum americanum]|uniref:TAFII28-like protein domain-containing protein n=1 Tax=Glutinoglossum americanum TaxID=1670608 RepID=A0A9P8L3L9_9PEZI|nr:hypothetical protein FGG08_000605 [Glutinoglossum americanum]